MDLVTSRQRCSEVARLALNLERNHCTALIQGRVAALSCREEASMRLFDPRGENIRQYFKDD